MNYINEICNGCGRKFTESDDIVVCPECGTPQHRECWLKERKCVNEHLHDESFEWRPKHAEEKTEQAQPVAKRPCPFCGYENPVDAEKCENCSQPFSMFGRSVFPKDDGQTHTAGKTEYSYKPPFEVEYKEPDGSQGYSPFGQRPENAQGQSFIFNAVALEPTVLGTPTKDFVSYIRANINSYYKKFKKLERGKLLTFNFGAFFFNPIWFFFRKLYKAGIVFLSLTVCLTMLFYNPLSKALDAYADLRDQIEVIQGSETMSNDEKTDAILEKTYAFAQSSGSVMYAYVGCTGAVNLIAALIADRLYKRKYLKDINAINEEAGENSEQKYLLTLQKGGVTLFAPVGAYIVMQALVQLLIKVFFE